MARVRSAINSPRAVTQRVKLLGWLIHRTCGSFRPNIRDLSEMRSPCLVDRIVAGVGATKTLSHRNTSATDFVARSAAVTCAAVTCTVLVGQGGPLSNPTKHSPRARMDRVGHWRSVTSQSDAPGIKLSLSFYYLLRGSIAAPPAFLSANRRLAKAVVRVEVLLSSSSDSNQTLCNGSH